MANLRESWHDVGFVANGELLVGRERISRTPSDSHADALADEIEHQGLDV